MNVHYLNWRPNRLPGTKDEFSDFNLLTMIVSSLKMRSYGHRTKLYCDSYTVHKMEELHLSDVWNILDGESLDQQIDSAIYNTSSFFNIGKFFILDMESAPCMLMDTDLILWENPHEFLDQAALFTHWEAVWPYTEWYCQKESLHLPDGYSLKKTWDFRLPAANTSIMYFKYDRLKNYYCREALKFLRHNFFTSKFINSELLFVEQRLFLMCLQEMQALKFTKPLIDIVWNPTKGYFTSKHPNCSWWNFYLPDPSEHITHTWISKKAMERNQKYRNYYCCRLLEEIQKLSPGILLQLEKIQTFDSFFSLLHRYGDIPSIIESGSATDILYPSSPFRTY